MADDLENLIERAESDINNRTQVIRAAKQEQEKKQKLPRLSFALGVWILVAILAAFQFDTVISLVTSPTESKIESDLADLLRKTSLSLEHYETENGELPMLLPNSAIRGLVKYDRRSDFTYRLSATVHTVTMVMDSASARPRRE